jgi:hypothetical protein
VNAAQRAMPRPAKASNTIFFFSGSGLLSPAELILRMFENARDSHYLREMNGEKCAGRQISRLKWYDRPAKQSE